jgi:hypothetical protein
MNNKLKEIFGPSFDLTDIDFGGGPNTLSLLNSDSLESNQLFKALKSELELYQKERKKSLEKQVLHKNKSQQWKDHFYHSLQTLMNEVLFTTDPSIKNILLEKIQTWYINKTNKSPISEKRNYFNLHPCEQESYEVYIPQLIHPKTSSDVLGYTPHIPKKLVYNSENKNSAIGLFDRLDQDLYSNTTLPKVKNRRSKQNFIRPISPSKNPLKPSIFLIKDFTKTSRARSTVSSLNKSPENFRNTSYTNQFLYDNTDNQSFLAVPNDRRIQIKEVMRTKKRLASNHIICPMKVLESGLVISDFTLDPLPIEKLPRGGELLMKDLTENKKTSKKRKKKSSKR